MPDFLVENRQYDTLDAYLELNDKISQVEYTDNSLYSCYILNASGSMITTGSSVNEKRLINFIRNEILIELIDMEINSGKS